MKFKIRIAKTKDKGRIIDIFNSQYVEHPFLPFIDRYFEGDPKMELLVAETTGHVVGACVNEYTTNNGKLQMDITIVVVMREYRMRGIFNLFMAKSIEQAISKKVWRVFRKHEKKALHINEDRETAAGWIITDAGENERMAERFLTYEKD